jgi:hypothetical protein
VSTLGEKAFGEAREKKKAMSSTAWRRLLFIDTWS